MHVPDLWPVARDCVTLSESDIANFMPEYIPPFTLTAAINRRVASIGRLVGRAAVDMSPETGLRLNRINRIRTIAGSLAIEGNSLGEAQITALLDGKRITAPPREILEVKNALAAYASLKTWTPASETDLLAAHRVLMKGLQDSPGKCRQSGVGVMSGDRVVHVAPPARRVPRLMQQLLEWVGGTNVHPLITGCVFHYEFEFIHPFADGNGRLGRLWQTLVLSHWQPLFEHLPVESLIHHHQVSYYRAIAESSSAGESTPFIVFMLGVIQDALEDSLTPQVTPQATPQADTQVSPQVVALLGVLEGDMDRAELQAELGLRDRKSFQQRYIAPALVAGWVERTLPHKPRSPLQKYRLSATGKALRRRIGRGKR